MLVTDEAIRRDIPHEPGQWIEFRRLSSAQLNRARKAREKEAREEAAGMLQILGPDFLRSLREGDTEQKQRIVRELEELEYQVSNYDIGILLKEGIVAWSYDGGLPSDGTNPTEMLDEKTARWAANNVIAITRPPTEEEEKNS